MTCSTTAVAVTEPGTRIAACRMLLLLPTPSGRCSSRGPGRGPRRRPSPALRRRRGLRGARSGTSGSRRHRRQEALARRLQDRRLAREALPSDHRHVDVGRVELERVDAAPRHLAGDDRRAGADEGVVDGLPGRRVVGDRPPHALHRLLGAVPEAAVFARRDRPQRRLRAIARPATAGVAAHRIPAGLVLPMIIAAAEREAVLGPDDLRADLEVAALQAGLDGRRELAGVPDVGDVAGEQRPGRAPVRLVVVVDLAELAGFRLTPARARQEGS